MHFAFQNEKATNSNEKDFQELQKETNKVFFMGNFLEENQRYTYVLLINKFNLQKIPRKKSVADIRPIYNCIHKHVSLFSSRCAPCGKCISLFCLRISWNGVVRGTTRWNNIVTVNGKLLSDFQLQQTDVFQEKTKKMVGSILE